MHRVITVDGPAGSGKGTVTKLVAKKLNYSAMDTGTIYRSIALYCRRNKISENEIEELKEALEKIDFKYITDGDNLTIMLNGEDVTSKIRTPEIDKYSSEVKEILDKDWRENLWMTIFPLEGEYYIDRDHFCSKEKSQPQTCEKECAGCCCH